MSDVNVSSAPAEATPSAPATPVAATPATPAQPVATQPAAQAPATQGAPAEDRTNWVPSYRLREAREQAVREAQQQFATREAEIRAEADRYKTQLHSLIGVQAPPNPEVTAVRDQFGNLYPGLAKLEAVADELLALREQAGNFASQNDHYWQSYGKQQVDKLFEHATTSLGSPLTDEGKRVLFNAFTGFVSSSPEIESRYASDPTLVTEWWKAFSSNFIDPARRVAAANVAGRAPGALPQDTPGGAPRSTPAPAMQNLDERAAAAWAQYNQGKT